MVNFEFTERMKTALKHALKNSPSMSPETKDKFERYVYLKGVKVIALEDLRELSEHLRRIPEDPKEDEFFRSCKWVHELVVGSKVMSDKKFSPTKFGKKLNPDMMGKLKFNEEKRMYQEMTSNLNREVERMTISDDLKTINEQISFGTHIILTMAVMYFAGYFVMLKANFDMVTAVVSGLICSIVAMMVETWLFMLRSERAEKKKERLELLRSPPRVNVSPTATSPAPIGEVTPLRNRPFTPLRSAQKI